MRLAHRILCTTLLAGWGGGAVGAELEAELRPDGKLLVCDRLFDVRDPKEILGEVTHCPIEKRDIASAALPGSILLQLDVAGLDPPGPLDPPPKPPPPPPRIGGAGVQNLLNVLELNNVQVRVQEGRRSDR